MGQPTPYVRQFNFTDFGASNPTTPPPGPSLDAELDAAKVTLDDVLRAIALIQRDDGRLKNQIVTLDSLSPAVMIALGAGVIWLPRGSWDEFIEYAVSDVVQSGTGSYVCAVAHTSAALFATDFAAGKWVQLFDTAGTTPADGSVTPAKLAAGSVTTPAIGFTGLDLAGSVRAATGLQAGTAPLGGLMHAKKASGDVFVQSERTADAQGAAGYQIIGVGVTWNLQQASGSNELSFKAEGSPIAVSYRALGGVDHTGHVRTTGSDAPASGAGIGLHYASATGYLQSYDYGATAWRDLKVRGKDVYITAQAVDVVKVTSTGVEITGTAKMGGVAMGYLGIPQNPQSGAYTLALTDSGKHVYSQNVAGQTIVIPTNATIALPVETAIVIVNDGTNPITVSTTGITLKQAGTGLTGNRTIATSGVATLLKVGTDRWFISGAGVS